MLEQARAFAKPVDQKALLSFDHFAEKHLGTNARQAILTCILSFVGMEEAKEAMVNCAQVAK
jgi:hypothetical protein